MRGRQEINIWQRQTVLEKGSYLLRIVMAGHCYVTILSLCFGTRRKGYISRNIPRCHTLYIRKVVVDRMSVIPEN